MVYVTLTRGQVAIVDAKDAKRVLRHKWQARKSKGGAWYAFRRFEYIGRREIVFLHRFILYAPDGVEVDHVNGDGLDNRRCNLRLATRSQNGCNRDRQVNNKIGFKGVCRHKAKRFRAQIMHKKKGYHLGLFTTAEAAARAYDEAAKELHGEFARLNFPDEG